LGLPGFRVLGVMEGDNEVAISIESTVVRAFCQRCVVRAEPRDRMPVDIRDLACFGRPARLVWRRRRWRCRESLCPVPTWTEHSEHLDAQAVLTRRAGSEACLP
jgi:transposase